MAIVNFDFIKSHEHNGKELYYNHWYDCWSDRKFLMEFCEKYATSFNVIDNNDDGEDYIKFEMDNEEFNKIFDKTFGAHYVGDIL